MVQVQVTPGLYTSADRFRSGDPATELEAAALRYAAKRLKRTGERNVADAVLLLEQMADDPCEEHSGCSPVCGEHERR